MLCNLCEFKIHVRENETSTKHPLANFNKNKFYNFIINLNIYEYYFHIMNINTNLVYVIYCMQILSNSDILYFDAFSMIFCIRDPSSENIDGGVR